MKKEISCILLLICSTLSATADWEPETAYYIQTREGLCLGNQNTNDNYAIIRFTEADDASNGGLTWYINIENENISFINTSNGKAIDNHSMLFANLYQLPANAELASQKWTITPVENKDGYFTITSVNFPKKNWSANYNGTVCITEPDIYDTKQWFRFSTTILPPDTETQPDERPVTYPGVTEVEFSTTDAPVWYKLNPYYANSPTANKANMLAYYDSANSKWLIKGANNTKANYDGFQDYDASLWRLEGNAKSFRLINKATGLALTNPHNVASTQRFTLSEQGSKYCLHHSNELADAMSPDAFYINPIDANVMNVGRVNVEGSAVELVLFKNGTADVTGGKGSTFIFMPVKERKVEATSANEDEGTVSIAKEDIATSYNASTKVFNFTPSSATEDVLSVVRAIANPVKMTATAKEGSEFLAWINTATNEICSYSPVYTYDGVEDASFKATFSSHSTGIDDVCTSPETHIWINEDGTLGHTNSVKKIAIYNAVGCLLISGSPSCVNLDKLPSGVLIVRMNNTVNSIKLVNK